MAARWYCAVVTALSLAGASASADDAIRERGIVIQATKKTYIVVVPGAEASDRQPLYGSVVYYGDGKTFYQHYVTGYMAPDKPGLAARLQIDDWRRIRDEQNISTADLKTWMVTCDKHTKQLGLAPESVAKKIVNAAEFTDHLPGHLPIVLARSGTTYYLVDRPRYPDDNKDYRLFIGKRGAMKQVKLKDLTADAQAVVLVSASGVFQITITPDELVPSFGRDEDHLKPLSNLKVDQNAKLVFGDLGVYRRENFAMFCDDL